MMSDQPAHSGGRIVVGVDGSESSKAALAWATRQAALTRGVVDAVAAWQIPTYYGLALADDGPRYKEVASSALDEAIAEAAAQAPGVVIHPLLAEGNAARVLLDAAKGADLLVVGSRGHSGFAEALLGSVGQRCVHHAECPVVVVH
jgi:nucleotide-binding universal stress UspA family protein